MNSIPEDQQLFTPELNERYENVLNDICGDCIRTSDREDIAHLVGLLGQQANYLKGNLIEQSGFDEDEALEYGWKTAWSGLEKVLKKRRRDEAVLVVATLIDRGVDDYFTGDPLFDDYGVPINIGLREFYKSFAGRLVNARVGQTGVWLFE